MSAQLKVGQRLASVVCTTEVMVVRCPDGTVGVDLRCGGAPMQPHGNPPEPRGALPSATTGTQLGKRYVDEADQLEVLCIKPGAGSLSVGDVALTMKTTKALPSSD